MKTYIFNVTGDKVETNEASQAWLEGLIAAEKRTLLERLKEQVLPGHISIGSEVYNPDGTSTHYTGQDAVFAFNEALDVVYSALEKVESEL